MCAPACASTHQPSVDSSGALRTLLSKYIYIYIHVMYMLYEYIYIYIEREREGERQRDSHGKQLTPHHVARDRTKAGARPTEAYVYIHIYIYIYE